MELDSSSIATEKNRFCFVVDTDGCLTDGKLIYGANGKAYKAFGSNDSDGLRTLVRMGVRVIMISADRTGEDINIARARDIGIPYERVSASERKAFIDRHNPCAFMGDSHTDYPSVRAAELGIAPLNAHPLSKKAAKHVCSRNGGDGAVLEACEVVALHLGRLDEFYAV